MSSNRRWAHGWVVLLISVGGFCLAASSGQKVTQTAGVDNTRMGAYRALAQLSLQALQKGDNATAAEYARILERTWDQGEWHNTGEGSYCLANRSVCQPIDQAMDVFIGPIMNSSQKAPDAAAVQAAYNDFLEKLKVAEDDQPRAKTTARPMSLETGYKVTKKFAVPGEGGWDYIAVDSAARRLYVSHGDKIQVLNADTGKVVGDIAAPGAHGVALAPDLGRGFTSNGSGRSVTVFDTKTLAVIKTAKLESGTDAILYDPFTKRVFPINEKITVLDAQTGDVVGTVDLGGDPEAAVSDGRGTVYVNLADKMAVAVVDPKALTVTKTYPIDHCTSPHSLSFDGATQRLFVGCREGFVALDATTGKAVATSMMCTGVDASGFDPESKLIFESCAEGVITVEREFTPDNYRIIETIPTKLWARTMAFDPKTKNIYLPTADFEFLPDSDPQKPPQRRWKADSFQVLVVSRNK